MIASSLFSVRWLFASAIFLTPLLCEAGVDTVKVGIAQDISGPLAGPGAEAKDGFTLAIKELHGKLGPLSVEFIQADTGGNPEQARQIVARMIQRDHIDLFTGPMGSNVAMAVGPILFSAKIPYLSNNAGPSQFAGAQCNEYFFGTAFQNDVYHEAAGQMATAEGFKKVVIIAPNYPAGKDAMTGFKRRYEAEVAAEIYTKIGQIDYAIDLAKIRAIKPDAVYFFLPGAMGINFIKQYMGAGISSDTALISTGFSADEDIIRAVGRQALGLLNTSHWAHDLDVPVSRKFVENFRKEFKRYPSIYAAQAYDVIQQMNAAMIAVAGKIESKSELLRVLRAAKFDSIRGSFRYNTNQFPIQNYYTRRIVKDADGVITNKLVNTILRDYEDSYVSECPLK